MKAKKQTRFIGSAKLAIKLKAFHGGGRETVLAVNEVF